jgi:hypothetical protein
MEIACPACGKANDLGTATACARCGCDLAGLVRILAGAVWHLKAAARELRGGDWETALEHAETSWSLRHSSAAARAAYLAAMGLRSERDARQWRRRARATGTRAV